MSDDERRHEAEPRDAADVYIVGLGIVGVRQLTREVEGALRRSREVLYVDLGYGVVDHLLEICERVTDLFPSYIEGEPRIDAYDRMASAVLDAAIDHPPVAFAVYGHPAMLVYPTAQIRSAARVLGLTVDVLPGISALDSMIIDLGFDPGFRGLQMYEATDLLLRDRPLQPDVPCLLWQVGALETALYSREASTPERFVRLQEHLLKFYPEEHTAVAVLSSSYPLVPSSLSLMSIGEFATQYALLPQGGTVYIPEVGSRAIADEWLLEAVSSAEHLSRITAT